MILVLRQGAEPEKIENLKKWLSQFDVVISPIEGTQTTVIGLVGDTSSIDMDAVSINPIVEKVIKVQESYKKANRKFHPANSVVDVAGVPIGGNRIMVIGGPCSVESKEQVRTVANSVKAAGATILRGGTFKPRSSPYSFQGMRVEGLHILRSIKQETGLPVVSEITNPFHTDIFLDFVDMIQVGARNMQNFELLMALGKVDVPILLKRGFSNTLDELLMAAEYIMSGGNEKVILCERGIRTFETSTRSTLDLSAVPVLKARTHLPVVVDPSHAAGVAWLVPALAKAAIAVGADGLEIEVHPKPEEALSDGAQSLTLDAFSNLMDELSPVAQAVGRTL